MLKVIYNKLEQKSEDILSEQLVGFRPHRNNSDTSLTWTKEISTFGIVPTFESARTVITLYIMQ
jgi:hypothetical protein